MACTATGTLRLLAVQSTDCNTSCTGHIAPSGVKAHGALVAALNDMHTWEEHHYHGKEMLKDMLQSRSEAAELSKKYDTRWASGS